MRCTHPRTVGFYADGKTLCWSPKKASKEYATFQLPCGQCIDCRLDYARQWAIRCVHEASMHPQNSFVTLTYNDENLKSPKLIYEDFQLFMKKLRKTQNDPIGFFVTGEYGDKTKRPHWHAILFNYQPKDSKFKYANERGDQVFSSESLTKIWGKGIAEYGSVTFQSAGYCARYAAKKLVHGKDGEHEYNPISKKSNKHAIGKKWLEQYHEDVFNYGHIVLSDGTTSTIPRYYEKWLKENKPDLWLTYVTRAKQNKIDLAAAQSEKEKQEHQKMLDERDFFEPNAQTRNQVKAEISKQKFNELQKRLKL